MWGILAAAGGALAGLAILGSVLPALLKAWSTGVIVSKAYGAPRIERASDPQRFRSLLETRVRTMWSGLGIFAVSAFLLAYQLFSLWVMTRH